MTQNDINKLINKLDREKKLARNPDYFKTEKYKAQQKAGQIKFRLANREKLANKARLIYAKKKELNHVK